MVSAEKYVILEEEFGQTEVKDVTISEPDHIVCIEK